MKKTAKKSKFVRKEKPVTHPVKHEPAKAAAPVKAVKAEAPEAMTDATLRAQIRSQVCMEVLAAIQCEDSASLSAGSVRQIVRDVSAKKE